MRAESFSELVAQLYGCTQHEAHGLLELRQVLINLERNKLFWVGLQALCASKRNLHIVNGLAESGPRRDTMLLQAQTWAEFPRLLQNHVVTMMHQEHTWMEDPSVRGPADFVEV